MSIAMRRIYWLCESFYPPELGGSELMAAAITAGLAERGLPIEVITRHTTPPSPYEEWLGPVRVRRIPPAGLLRGKGWRAVPAMLGLLARVAWLLIRESARYEVVIVSGMKVLPLVAVPVCRLMGKRCIVRIASYFELREAISAKSVHEMGLGGTRLQRTMQYLHGLVLRRADWVVAMSAEIEEALSRVGVAAARIVRIANGVDLIRFRPSTREEKTQLRMDLGLPVDRTLALYVGRLSKAKGLPLLIEAWRVLHPRSPDLCLAVVGSGASSFDDCEADIRRAVHECGLEDSVRFFEGTPVAHRYLQAADLFVLPSEYEGFSTGLIEALACGLPVVATAVGAAPQVIEHGANGFLCAPGNSAALIAAMEAALAARGTWDAIGAAARRTANSYSLAETIDRYSALITEPQQVARGVTLSLPAR